MPWSDLNVVVTFRQRFLNERDVLKNVEHFNSFLQGDRDFVFSSEFGERKNITLMKIIATQHFSSKRVEIIFRRMMIQTLPRTENIITGYLETYPISRGLYFAIRRIFHLAELDDPADGGINTLAIFLLIIAFIQKIESASFLPEKTFQKTQESFRSIEITECTENKNEFSEKSIEKIKITNSYISAQKLGELFLNLIYFYGFMFDYGANFIQTYLSQLSKCHPFHIKKDSTLNSLMILNPYDHNIIITKSFKKTVLMKQMFKLLYNHQFQNCTCTSVKQNDLCQKIAKVSFSKLILNRQISLNENRIEPPKEEYLIEFQIVEPSRPKMMSASEISVNDKQHTADERKTKVRSRLSSKSMKFVSALPKESKEEHLPAPAMFGYKLYAFFAYNLE